MLGIRVYVNCFRVHALFGTAGYRVLIDIFELESCELVHV